MKKLIIFCAGAMTLTSMVACGVKDRKEIAARYANLKGQPKTTVAPKLDATDAKSCQPGQAGSISVGGILLKADADHMYHLDEGHVSVALISGKNDATNTAASTANNVFTQMTPPIQASLDLLEKQAAAQTYINLGCQESDLPTDTIKNWKEVQLTEGVDVSDKTMTAPSANTVFVCGSARIATFKLVTLTADQMVFKTRDASLALADSTVGSLSILVNKLTLNGSNAIAVKTQDAQSFAGAGVTLGVNVLKTLDTDDAGKLALTSTGGNCIAAVEEKAAAQDGDKTLDARTTGTTDTQIDASATK